MTFISESDFDYKIRSEIKALLDGTADKTNIETAVAVAISTIKMYIGGRYTLTFLDVVQTIPPASPDPRNRFFVDMVLAIALYKLYGQVGTRDIPEHRTTEYLAAIQWLKDAGRGDIDVSGLDGVETDEEIPGFGIESRPPTNWKT